MTNSLIRANRFNANQIIISWENGNNESVPNCYCSEILRKTDKDIVYDDEEKFCDNSLSCNISFDNVIVVSVRYYASELKSKLIFTEDKPLIPKTRQTNDSVQNNEIPNILLLGIDSASNLNFERHCHKTMNLLKEQNFYRLNGYTRIGYNTFPNTLNYKTFDN
jgi:hypothetical protein